MLSFSSKKQCKVKHLATTTRIQTSMICTSVKKFLIQDILWQEYWNQKTLDISKLEFYELLIQLVVKHRSRTGYCNSGGPFPGSVPNYVMHSLNLALTNLAFSPVQSGPTARYFYYCENIYSRYTSYLSGPADHFRRNLRLKKEKSNQWHSEIHNYFCLPVLVPWSFT